MLREKMTFPSVFSSKSQTLPPEKRDKRHREVTFQTAAQYRVPDRTSSRAVRAKGMGRCPIQRLPDRKAKLLPRASDTSLTSSNSEEMV